MHKHYNRLESLKKSCYKCNMKLSVNLFSKNKRNKDGLQDECKECSKLRQKVWKDKNPDYHEKYRNLKGSEYYRIAQQKHLETENGRAKNKVRKIKYRIAKLHGTPKECSIELKNEILKFYTKAAELTVSTGIKHEVDHIEPLQGINTCGLHVPWNLQILTQKENRVKGNR